MKRLMLSTAAVLALSAPVLAQSDAETFVNDALMTRGYDAAEIETLSDAEVAELYTVLTSGDETEIQAAIDGFMLPSDETDTALADTPRDDNIDTIAAQALSQAGYPEGTIDTLSDAEVVELYTAATSADATEVRSVIDGFGLGEAVATAEPSSADRFVESELERRGISDADIASLTSSEKAELFVVLTSGDETEIRSAIESAIDL